MRNTLAISQRELLSIFCSPIAYIVIFGFLFVTGVLVWMTDSFSPGKPATLRGVFFWTPLVLTVIIPAITMRMISEEYRSGTIESLMTAPVTDAQFVIGKFLAGLVFYVVMLAATLIYIVMMLFFGNPDLGAAFSGYLGLLMVGLPFLAFGVLTSSLTKNQIIAWILAWMPLMLLAFMAFYVAPMATGIWRTILQNVNVMQRFEQFNQGQVWTDSLIFFIGTTAVFLFCAIKVVETRRWR